MILDGATVATTVVSLMMNGVCCAFQHKQKQKDEQDRREALRRDIRTEYWNQRILDMEMMEQQQRRRPIREEERRYDSDTSRRQDDRRRQLLLDKLDASHRSNQSLSPRTAVISPTSKGLPQTEAFESTVQCVAVTPTAPESNNPFPPDMRRRFHDSSRGASFLGGDRLANKQGHAASGVPLSLMDESSDDDGDAQTCSSLETLEF